MCVCKFCEFNHMAIWVCESSPTLIEISIVVLKLRIILPWVLSGWLVFNFKHVNWGKKCSFFISLLGIWCFHSLLSKKKFVLVKFRDSIIWLSLKLEILVLGFTVYLFNQLGVFPLLRSSHKPQYSFLHMFPSLHWICASVMMYNMWL